MGYVFISYSSKERAVADAMRQMLMDNEISVWMAPWDIPVGSDYANEIDYAICNSSCVILMLSEAAKQSDPEGLFRIGLCYYRGRGIEQSVEEAAKWFRKAAEPGDEHPLIKLGECYRHGYSKEEDYNRAVKILRERMVQGDKIAALQLEEWGEE